MTGDDALYGRKHGTLYIADFITERQNRTLISGGICACVNDGPLARLIKFAPKGRKPFLVYLVLQLGSEKR